MLPVPRRNRRSTAITLGALAAAFLVSAGVFVALFVGAAGDHTTTADQLTDRRGELADLEDRVSAADSERQRSEGHNNGLESENSDLTPCVEAMQTYLWDPLTPEQVKAALDQVITLCR